MLRKPRTINAELDHMLASMGHTDTLLVTDAGFPSLPTRGHSTCLSPAAEIKERQQ